MKLWRLIAFSTIAVVMLSSSSSGAIDYKATLLFPVYNPFSFPTSVLDGSDYGISADGLAGWKLITDGGNSSHATLWNIADGSAIDLHPAGFQGSFLHGASSSSQVGEGYGSATDYKSHALLWYGAADQVIDLNPSGFERSAAERVFGDNQIGNGLPSVSGSYVHVLLWHGSASSAIDLNPATFGESWGLAILEDAQVGIGRRSGDGVSITHFSGMDRQKVR